MEFAAKFHDDETCLNYLIKIRWPQGFVCPKCNYHGGWWLKKYHRFECSKCHCQTSPLAGTIMHRSHFPIHIWFWAIYLVTTHTPGISALQLQRQLGISKVKNTWYLLHRIRAAMVREDRGLLSGVIEADETYIGGPAKGYSGRGVVKAPNKSLIAGAVEIKTFMNKEGTLEEKAGRSRLQVLKLATETEVKKFLNKNVTKGSTIKSDGWRGYSNKCLQGYEHIVQVQETPDSASKLSPHIHKVFGNLQSWLVGIHHGVEPKYLQAYLDEFVFRFNRRTYPMSGFRSLIEILMRKKPLPLCKLKQP